MTWHCTCQYSKDQYFLIHLSIFFHTIMSMEYLPNESQKNVLFFLLFPIYIGLLVKEGVVKDIVEIEKEKSHHLSL